MRRLSDRFAGAAEDCADLTELGLLLREAALELGFDHFALLDHSSLWAKHPGLVRIDNYPAGWVEELTAGCYALDDPVHLASLRSSSGFRWDQLPKLLRLRRRHKMILARSRCHGLGDGFTVPANVPGEPSASCSFVVRAGREIQPQRLACAELIGAHALNAARRLRSIVAPPQRPHLSRRELQCLRLVAVGKTDWEIGRILGLGTETARQYVKSARAAYDAVSRTQLVVYALRDRWIDFDDSIPPDG